MRQGILKGTRVLDLTRIVAGPYATRILADYGAEVIKVQTARMATGLEANTTPYFCAWNRNKRSITLDLDHFEARRIFCKLTEAIDIVVENFSPRVMSNWELTYDDLKKVNEKLIMLSMSGMGQTGPWKDYVAFGPTVQSLGGLTHLTSYSRELPMGIGYAYADMIAGLYGATLMMAALEYRDNTGQGQYMDLSEFESACTAIGPALMHASSDLDQILPQGNHEPHIPAAPHGCYRCLGENRWCVISIFSDDEWETLCNVLGHPSFARDSRFSSLSNRKKNRKDLNLLIGKWMADQRAEIVVERLQRSGVPAGVVQNAQDLENDPQLLARGFFTSLDHPVLGGVKVDTDPIKFNRLQDRPWSASPLLGEANHYVFSELLGMTDDTIQSYVDRGIIA